MKRTCAYMTIMLIILSIPMPVEPIAGFFTRHALKKCGNASSFLQKQYAAGQVNPAILTAKVKRLATQKTATKQADELLEQLGLRQHCDTITIKALAKALEKNPNYLIHYLGYAELSVLLSKKCDEAGIMQRLLYGHTYINLSNACYLLTAYMACKGHPYIAGSLAAIGYGGSVYAYPFTEKLAERNEALASLQAIKDSLKS